MLSLRCLTMSGTYMRAHCRLQPGTPGTKMHSLHLQHAGRCNCLSQPSKHARTRNVTLAALPEHSRASGENQTSRSPASSFLLGGLAAATVLLSGGAGAGAIAGEINLTADPVYDGAGVLKAEARDALSQRLSAVDKSTGYHVRVFTQYQMDKSPDGPNPRGIWGSLDNNTVVVIVDPSSPNILNVPFIGDNVLAKLRRPFWTELQSRFGNLFFVREQGEAAALQGAMGALADCLERPDGCRVVPGLPIEQYYATLTCSVAGGLVAGFVSKIEPQGIVQRRWVWLLLFSPLWGSLFVNFGLGPIVSRTEDVAPIAANTAAFLVAAFLPKVLQQLWDGDATPPATLNDRQ